VFGVATTLTLGNSVRNRDNNEIFQAGLFTNNRRIRWPFHIQRPDSTIAGRKMNRVGKA
jgi:hypothetical protein